MAQRPALVDTVEDTHLLQEDLNKIYAWAEQNNMVFNESKFEVLRYGRNTTIKEVTQYRTKQGAIAMKNSLRDLGVVMDSEGTYSLHITSISETAKRMVGWILRTFSTRDEQPMLTLWKSLVLPKLEYCCQLWSPDSIGEIQELEAVQRTFTSRISSVKHLDYWERLKHLRLYSLQRRRERYQIIYTWKILEGLVPNVGITLSQNRTRGRTCYIKGLISNCPGIKTLRSSSFMRNGPRLFNSLPPHLKNMSSCTVEAFKVKLDAFLQKIDDTPPVPSYHTWPHYNKLVNCIPPQMRQLGGSSGSPCS